MSFSNRDGRLIMRAANEMIKMKISSLIGKQLMGENEIFFAEIEQSVIDILDAYEEMVNPTDEWQDACLEIFNFWFADFNVLFVNNLSTIIQQIWSELVTWQMYVGEFEIIIEGLI